MCENYLYIVNNIHAKYFQIIDTFMKLTMDL